MPAYGTTGQTSTRYVLLTNGNNCEVDRTFPDQIYPSISWQNMLLKSVFPCYSEFQWTIWLMGRTKSIWFTWVFKSISVGQQMTTEVEQMGFKLGSTNEGFTSPSMHKLKVIRKILLRVWTRGLFTREIFVLSLRSSAFSGLSESLGHVFFHLSVGVNVR